MTEIIEFESWEQFKNIIEKKKINIQYQEKENEYNIFISEGNIIWSYLLFKTTPVNSDQEDFENNYKNNANQPIIIKASDSTPYVRVTEKTVGKYLQLYGLEITCPNNQTSNYDIKWTVDLEFVGARAVDEKNLKGNYANMQLIDKDNILGYGAGFVLHEFGKNIPSALLYSGCNVETTTAATINKGLYIRIQYINNSDEDTTLNAALKYYV